MVRFILLDIEGTTTDIQFVHRVLFPYSAERLPAYVRDHAEDEQVRQAIQSVKDTVQQEESRVIDDAGAIETLLTWIQQDRKHTALKQLQGLIWKEGFEKQHYQGHVYEDVPHALRNWKHMGIELGIYSSGSVQAQKLLFGYSVSGDLTPLFSHYFDTKVGGKREVTSYQNILAELNLHPMEVMFLSDVEAELDAARLAGMKTVQLLREGTEASTRHETTATLLSINIPDVALPQKGFY